MDKKTFSSTFITNNIINHGHLQFDGKQFFGDFTGDTIVITRETEDSPFKLLLTLRQFNEDCSLITFCKKEFFSVDPVIYIPDDSNVFYNNETEENLVLSIS